MHPWYFRWFAAITLFAASSPVAQAQYTGGVRSVPATFPPNNPGGLHPQAGQNTPYTGGVRSVVPNFSSGGLNPIPAPSSTNPFAQFTGNPFTTGTVTFTTYPGIRPVGRIGYAVIPVTGGAYLGNIPVVSAPLSLQPSLPNSGGLPSAMQIARDLRLDLNNPADLELFLRILRRIEEQNGLPLSGSQLNRVGGLTRSNVSTVRIAGVSGGFLTTSGSIASGSFSQR